MTSGTVVITQQRQLEPLSLLTVTGIIYLVIALGTSGELSPLIVIILETMAQ
jgi:hypothetical protein